MDNHVIIFGATSEIGKDFSVILAKNGFNLIQVGRDEKETTRCCNNLEIRFGISAQPLIIDASKDDLKDELITNSSMLKNLKGIAWFWGDNGPKPSQEAIESIPKVVMVNLTSAMIACEILTPFLSKGSFILLVSSVAGVRGRRKNYWYGATKSALSIFGEGLRHRLVSEGIKVNIAKLGLIDTRMATDVDSKLKISPEKAAFLLWRMVKKKKSVSFIPSSWGLIMNIIRLLPESIFNRLDF